MGGQHGMAAQRRGEEGRDMIARARPLPGLDWLSEDWQPSPLRDALTAAILTIIAFWAAFGEAHPQDPTRYFKGPLHPPDTPPAAFLLVIAAGVVLAWRHRHPRAVLCASTAAVAAYSLGGWVNGSSLLLPAVALGTLAAMVPARQAIMWAVGALLVLGGATMANNPLGTTGGGVTVLPFTIAVATLAGIAIANRRAYARSVRGQAEREAQRRIDEERLRIARELHDVVAHTMATITVQAAAASQLLTASPERAAESLAAIRAASKDGLRELRAILGVLRNADEPADPTAPVPGLSGLDALAARVRQAGLPVTVMVDGQPRPLPAVTDVSAFRIIQEALTNTVRHAGPATATIAVRYGADDLRIEVRDDGKGGPVIAGDGGESGNGAMPGSGHGLRGMRERAAAAGATIEIGPVESGGFRVAARFPCPASGEGLPSPRGGCRLPCQHDIQPARGAGPRAARRRPGADPGGLPGPAGGGRRCGRGRRGGQRRAGRQPGQGAARRPRADGHPDARGGRAGGDPADRRR
jgi:signal transduction histidine kinase